MFGCKKCAALEKENAYLKSLVDRFLQKFQMQPIESVSSIGAQVKDEIAREEEAIGTEHFGGD